MRRVPWHLAFRVGRKGALTAVGVALAVAFSVASFSVAHALEGDILGLGRNYEGSAVVVHSSDHAPFDIALLEAFPRARGVHIHEGVDASGTDVVVVSYVGPDAPHVPPGVALGEARGPVVVEGIELAMGGPTDEVPRGWLLANASSFSPRTVVPYAIVKAPSEEAVARLMSMGYDVEPVPALQSFFRASGIEIAGDLLLVVAFSSLLAMLFCYEFLRAEVRERRREIGIWRAIGMRRGDVVSIFLVRSLLIAAAAFVLGTVLALGSISLALGKKETALSHFSIDAAELALMAGAFLLASLAGGLLPAFAAGRISVQQALETT